MRCLWLFGGLSQNMMAAPHYYDAAEATPMVQQEEESNSLIQVVAYGCLVGAMCFGALAYNASVPSATQLSLATSTMTGRATNMMPSFGYRPGQVAPRSQDSSLNVVADDRPLNLDELSSRVDRPIPIPDKVKVELKDGVFTVEGPHGKLVRSVPPEVSIRQENGILMVYYDPSKRNSRAMFGLYQALFKNMVIGVSEKFTKKMEMVGVGYRAKVQGKQLILNVGKSHDVIMDIPEGIEVKVEENTKIEVTSIDNEALGQFCANVRKERPPEPYKGKGIRFAGEQIILKAGKK